MSYNALAQYCSVIYIEQKQYPKAAVILQLVFSLKMQVSYINFFQFYCCLTVCFAFFFFFSSLTLFIIYRCLQKSLTSVFMRKTLEPAEVIFPDISITKRQNYVKYSSMVGAQETRTTLRVWKNARLPAKATVSCCPCYSQLYSCINNIVF